MEFQRPILSEQLLELGQQRCGLLQQKWPQNSSFKTDVGQRILQTMCALSDFVFQSCERSEALTNYFLQIANEQDLLIDVPFDNADYLNLDETGFLKQVRSYRHFVMSVIAARDFLKLQSIQQTMQQLSRLGDEFYLLARSWAKEQLVNRWGKAIAENGDEVELVALGMGKLGGAELNFSSDIDLIFCYAEKGETSGGRQRQSFQVYFTKLAQKIIQVLDSVTADGRVFRVDMRLRPFGDSGPLVSSFDAIEDYYQEQGRDWERYALLKARPLGEFALSRTLSVHEKAQHAELKQLLKPFVYRRYIDFSVIDSLRKMKRMIQQEVTRRNLQLNIKLGVGGIREAEFIVQALQMLRGGKHPELQQPSLLLSLPLLTRLNTFTESEAKGLESSYIWLRQCEQYLQAFADEQTQTLPNDPLNQSRLICLFGNDCWQDFLQNFQQICETINELFVDVIGDDESQNKDNTIPQQYTDVWALAEQYTGAQHESEYLRALAQQLSFVKPELLKSVSGSRGMEKLDTLVPLIVYELVQQQVDLGQVGSVFKLIKRIASRTTYLELLVENDGARTQLIKLVTSCRFIGEQLTRFPLLLDMLIDPKLLYSPNDLSSYYSEIRRQLLRVEPDDLETQMEVLRQFKLSNQLAIAACDVEGVLNLMQVSDHLTALAEACLQQVMDIAWQQMVARYGYPDCADDQNRRFGVIGYGKLGGFELGYGSDLDVVFVHSCKSSGMTDGKKAIDSRQFYLKLAQRITHIFTTTTLSGELYEVDTRLRPSGASGLLAINIETFGEYQREEAWTWEHQALVRSRYIVGDEVLKQRFNQIRTDILCMPRDVTELKQDIAKMRTKMFDNLSKESEQQFDLKQSRGGVADIEFIVQMLVLSQANRYAELTNYPDNVRLIEIASNLALITEQDKQALTAAYIDYRDLYHLQSLNSEEKLVDKESINDHKQNVVEVWHRLFE
ncbi:MAG: bifunctional [glutamate--ammonia ligase]-adenylyl-L-tyrosine phosphorylase/[glutamate--ammonia-ligase] adenylyltransferase [Gammaproteobacteria bacterium]|nr:bifunctional [glutamate--ammonia ligase]-adenylyl-L-tyrosine phosphorylase/[glutamate--ammonia-ligase] adenylyltransferase [Gammaproteobacteria bacterium]